MVSLLEHGNIWLRETKVYYPLHLVKAKDHIIASGGYLSLVPA